MNETLEKMADVIDAIAEQRSILIAFSGGADSSVLASLARQSGRLACVEIRSGDVERFKSVQGGIYTSPPERSMIKAVSDTDPVPTFRFL